MSIIEFINMIETRSELFKSWFGEDIDQKVIEAAILYWFKDDDCKSNSKLWNHFKEN